MAVHCVSEEKNKYLLKVDTYAGGVHVLVFKFIDDLHVCVSQFDEFQTLKIEKNSLRYMLCFTLL